MSRRSYKELKILFLAKYADKNPENVIKEDPSLGVAPFYHHEIKTILQNLGYNISFSSSRDFLLSNIQNYDYIFSLLNQGTFKNSEIFVSAICEYYNKPYLGAPPNIRAIAEDKNLAKILAKKLKIPTPNWRCYDINCKIIKPEFKGPYFIKPRMAASSYGVNDSSIQNNWMASIPKIKELWKNNFDVILEQFIPGRNITFPIIADIDYSFFNCIESKSDLEGNIILNSQKRIVSKGLSRSIYKSKFCEKIKEYSNLMYRELQPIDYARFDFRVNETTNEIYFIEVNICSNLGSHSSIAQSGLSKGISQKKLIKKILNYSFKRQKV